jgi:hypothetical protein
MESISIIEGNSKLGRGAIPEILTQALGVSFDSSIGHDYTEDFESQYEYYNRKDEKVSFGIDLFDRITNGGVSKKTLNLLIMGTGVGKTMTMCFFAGQQLLARKERSLYHQ